MRAMGGVVRGGEIPEDRRRRACPGGHAGGRWRRRGNGGRPAAEGGGMRLSGPTIAAKAEAEAKGGVWVGEAEGAVGGPG